MRMPRGLNTLRSDIHSYISKTAVFVTIGPFILLDQCFVLLHLLLRFLRVLNNTSAPCVCVFYLLLYYNDLAKNAMLQKRRGKMRGHMAKATWLRLHGATIIVLDNYHQEGTVIASL